MGGLIVSASTSVISLRNDHLDVGSIQRLLDLESQLC
jgi:hypothetical protein